MNQYDRAMILDEFRKISYKGKGYYRYNTIRKDKGGLMDLLNNFGKKITQSSQDAMKKAKDFAEVTKLNGLISDEERIMNGLYMQIGIKYFEIYSGTMDDNFIQLCSCIKECQKKISSYEKEVQKIKNIRLCPECGQECNITNAFCSVCGTKLAEVEESFIYCHSCGSELTKEDAFCTKCGQKVEKDTRFENEEESQESMVDSKVVEESIIKHDSDDSLL